MLRTSKPKVVMIEVREYQPGGRYKTFTTLRFYDTTPERVVRLIKKSLKKK